MHAVTHAGVRGPECVLPALFRRTNGRAGVTVALRPAR